MLPTISSRSVNVDGRLPMALCLVMVGGSCLLEVPTRFATFVSFKLEGELSRVESDEVHPTRCLICLGFV